MFFFCPSFDPRVRARKKVHNRLSKMRKKSIHTTTTLQFLQTHRLYYVILLSRQSLQKLQQWHRNSIHHHKAAYHHCGEMSGLWVPLNGSQSFVLFFSLVFFFFFLQMVWKILCTWLWTTPCTDSDRLFCPLLKWKEIWKHLPTEMYSKQ